MGTERSDLVRDEEAVSPSAAEPEFVRARSKATADHFERFATERGLDLDVDTWPDADREEFHRRARARRRVEGPGGEIVRRPIPDSVQGECRAL